MLERHGQLLGHDLAEDGARALADFGRADEEGDAAVGFHADDGGRDRVRSGGEQPDAHAAPDDSVRLGRVPIETGGDLPDIADQIGVERLAAGAHRFAAVQEVAFAHLQRVEPAAAADLVDLQFAAPLQVTLRRRRGRNRRGRYWCRRPRHRP